MTTVRSCVFIDNERDKLMYSKEGTCLAEWVQHELTSKLVEQLLASGQIRFGTNRPRYTTDDPYARQVEYTAELVVVEL